MQIIGSTKSSINWITILPDDYKAVISGSTNSDPSGGVTYSDGKYGYVSGTTTLYNSLINDLVRELAAPLPPKEISFWSLVGWSALFYLSVCIIIGPVLVWRAFKNDIIKNLEDQEEVFTPDVSYKCILFLILGWYPPFWLFIPSVRKC